MVKKIAVIGGGITGLSAAFYAEKAAEKSGLSLCTELFEATGRLGGKIDTLRRDGYVIERGPDSFLKRKRAALDLVHDLDLDHLLVENRTGRSYILKNKQLHAIPSGSMMGIPGDFRAFLESDLLSAAGKARVFEELLLPFDDWNGDVSVGTFFEKRFGREMVESIIDPLLSGVYGGDLYSLSLEATLPQFKKIVGQSGSLLKHLHNRIPEKQTSQFATLKTGLSSLVSALAQNLQGEIRTSVPVREIAETEKNVTLVCEDGQRVYADGVILTVPLDAAARFFPGTEVLKREHAVADSSMTTVSMAFAKSAVNIGQEGTGFVAADRDLRSPAAATWTHLKWPHTAPEGKAMIRTFLSGIRREDDQELVGLSLRCLNQIDDLTVEGQPEFSVVTHMDHSMPQYEVGHKAWLKHVREVMHADHPKVRLAGMAYDGVGLPDCIRQGKEAAKDLVSLLN